jgi:NADP-reducing hydrogenase subunit HndB
VARIEKEYLVNLFESDYRMGYIVMYNIAGVMSLRFHDMQKSPLTSSYAMVKITVHMATCGIAAGAREVMSALQEEILRTERHDIVVENSGCIGKCSSEPNVTVEIEGEEPVIYQLMNADNMRRVFEEHIINGKVSEDLVLT